MFFAAQSAIQVFILVGLGIAGGVGLIVVEILYHKHKLRRDKRAEAAKEAISKWKGTIEVSQSHSSTYTIPKIKIHKV